jgi:hypothetical protein
MGRRAVLLFLCAFAACAATGAQARTPLPGIRTPSGNISCFFVAGPPGHVLCSIRHAAYARALQDRCGATASLDWHGFELTPRRKGTFVCSGGVLYDSGTSVPRYVTLPYGRTWTRGPFTCYSRVAGLSCGNHTGHGLFVSRQSWHRW